MNKLSFSQKNDLVVKHKAKKHFGKDLELFQKHFPSNKLMNDLARANEFSFERLDGQMLYILLDKVSVNEILENRNERFEEQIIQEKQPADIDKNKNPIIPPVLPGNEPIVPPVSEEETAKMKELSKRIDELEENVEINESDIEYLRDELSNKDASIEALESKISELELKATVKKKD
jgi:hypothetical protein